jgi:hypothetical protein
MNEIFDIKSPKFLGGANVHSLLIITSVALVGWKLGAFKK